MLHSYLRHSWETIPSSQDCLIWNSHFLSQTWNSLVCVLKTEPSHLQGSEPCPRDQLDEMYELKLKTFVSCSLSRNCSLTTELNTEECINIYALPEEVCFIIFFCFHQVYLVFCWEHILSVSWASYCSFSSPSIAKVWSFFPLRYTWALFSSHMRHVQNLVEYFSGEQVRAWTVVYDDGTIEVLMPNYRLRAGS